MMVLLSSLKSFSFHSKLFVHILYILKYCYFEKFKIAGKTYKRINLNPSNVNIMLNVFLKFLNIRHILFHVIDLLLY